MNGTKAPPPGGKPPDEEPAPGESSGKPQAQGQDPKSGRVTFDSRGNAVWEWSMSTGAYGRDVDSKRLEKLNPKDLKLVEEPAKPAKKDTAPSKTDRGLDPYNSAGAGIAPGKSPAKPKDLKKLGEWLKLQKELGKKVDKE